MNDVFSKSLLASGPNVSGNNPHAAQLTGMRKQVKESQTVQGRFYRQYGIRFSWEVGAMNLIITLFRSL